MANCFSKFNRTAKFSIALGLLGFISGCAHELKPVKISSDASPTAEISAQRNLIDQAYNQQIDVLAPRPLQKAEAFLLKATKSNDSGKSPDDVLESIGYSKSYLNKANEAARQIEPRFSDVVKARSAALLVGAKSTHSNEISSLDKKFRSFTEDVEDSNSVKAEEKTTLQSKYLDLELFAIKKTNLNEIRNLIAQAKNKGAEKVTPVAYDQAVQKLNATEKTIETDRHSTAEINLATKDAMNSARHLMSLLESAQLSKTQTPEQRADTLDAREKAADHANALAADARLQSKTKDLQIAQQGANLELVKGQNTELKQREQEDAIVSEAEAQFGKSEADVYRQDGNLVIRLKTMNFASGGSDLPADSMQILTKVKDVIKKLGATGVTVEGHTDGLGTGPKNQALSEKRAKAVAKFFNADQVLAESKIESTGYGFTKPIATNKTKEGRAQNRRVDLIIKTVQN